MEKMDLKACETHQVQFIWKLCKISKIFVDPVKQLMKIQNWNNLKIHQNPSNQKQKRQVAAQWQDELQWDHFSTIWNTLQSDLGISKLHIDGRGKIRKLKISVIEMNLMTDSFQNSDSLAHINSIQDFCVQDTKVWLNYHLLVGYFLECCPSNLTLNIIKNYRDIIVPPVKNRTEKSPALW